ncbi:MAG: DUF3617 family protein [Proteobacteria bacterium]|nr:DUF3617 family protein [Pseudomonadota bacterium]
MVRKLIITAMLVLAWVSAGSAEIKEGLWEITTTSEMKGVPVQLPPSTLQQCITKKDLVPKSDLQGAGQDCRIKDEKVGSNTVSYVVECKDKDGNIIEISGKTNYRGNVFDGAATTTVKTKDQGTMQMTSTTLGRYIGPCAK